MTTEATVASILLENEAVLLRPDEPFRYTSGMLSPIYTDNRLLLSFPEARGRVVDLFVAAAKEHFADATVIAGTATAGIAWAAWLADALELPMVYVRDKAKSHGRQNQIEGQMAEDDKVIVVEDLISTGGSSLAAAEAVKEAGAEPLGVLAIFTYGLNKAADAFAEADLPLVTLTDFPNLAAEAERLGKIDDATARERLTQWSADPAGWGAKMGFE